MTAPLVDVLMPTYNHGKFVAEAIESVLAQQFSFTYRLIIADDCSSDETQQIFKSYAARYPDRIETLILQEHVGIFHEDRASLKALKLCTAKYVALLEGDDYWTDPLKLQKQTAYMESHLECALSFHNVEVFYEDDDRPSWNFCPPAQKEVSTLADLLDRNFIPTPSVMFRRNCLREIPSWVFELKMGDWLLHILHAQNGSVGYIDEVMAAYRIHSSGLWSKQTPIESTLEEVKMYQALERYLPPQYQDQIETSLARRYYKLAVDYRNQGDWLSSLSNVWKCLGCSSPNRDISLRHLARISLPGRATFSK